MFYNPEARERAQWETLFTEHGDAREKKGKGEGKAESGMVEESHHQGPGRGRGGIACAGSTGST